MVALLASLDNPVNLVLVLVVAFLIFGKNLPDAARSLGRGIRELKESTDYTDVADAINSVNEVRGIVNPTNIVRAAVPGVREVQDTVAATRDLVNNPLGPAAETSDSAATTESAPVEGAPAAPVAAVATEAAPAPVAETPAPAPDES
jgi:TatA/E family protein of Tat protein translocase